MFVSPCSLRSTQCAALIALAAAAGIARIESASTPHCLPVCSVTVNSLYPLASPLLGDFELSSTPHASWLRQVAALAVGWLSRTRAVESPDVGVERPIFGAGSHGQRLQLGTPRSTAISRLRVDGSTSSRPSANQDGGRDGIASGASWSPPASRFADPPQSAARPRRIPVCSSPCGVPHLLPLAVGPPLLPRHLSPNAVGTHVPGDSTANGWSGTKVAAPDEDSSHARIARLPCPGHPMARSDFPPQIARDVLPGSSAHLGAAAIAATGDPTAHLDLLARERCGSWARRLPRRAV